MQKKMKDYQISNIIIALNYCNLSANSLTMITQFLKMSINEGVILRYKEFYIKQQQMRINSIAKINIT